MVFELGLQGLSHENLCWFVSTHEVLKSLKFEQVFGETPVAGCGVEELISWKDYESQMSYLRNMSSVEAENCLAVNKVALDTSATK